MLKNIRFNKREEKVLRKFEKIIKKEWWNFSEYIKRFIEKKVEEYENKKVNSNK